MKSKRPITAMVAEAVSKYVKEGEMNPLPEYIDLDFEHVDFGILQRGKNESIPISWDSEHRCHVAISATTPEVYYKVDLLCDGSGFCTCPSFREVQAKKHRPCKHIIALDLQIAKKNKEGK